MTNSANGIQREIKVKGQKLDTVTNFKYLGAAVSDDDSKPEILSRTAQTTAALKKLRPIWRDNYVSLGSKVKLMRSLVISIFLYACESWTLTAELERKKKLENCVCKTQVVPPCPKPVLTLAPSTPMTLNTFNQYWRLMSEMSKSKLQKFCQKLYFCVQKNTCTSSICFK